MRSSPTATTQVVEPTGLLIADLIDEVAATLLNKPKRSVLTALGTFLGVGTLVAILGLTATASGQVSARFDALTATTVEIIDARVADDPTAAFPFDSAAISRIRSLNGVTGAGLLYAPRTDASVTSAMDTAAKARTIPIWAASTGVWDVVKPTLSAGRLFDGATEDSPVAVLGSSAAAQLGITGTQPISVLIGGYPFTVMGVFDDTERRQELRMGLVVPAATAQRVWGDPGPDTRATLLVSTVPGAARQVAAEARRVTSLAAPQNIQVADPPDPRQLRDAISADLSSLFLALAGISLLLGAVGIGNTTLVAVMERRAEIGLRRAQGARSRDIAVQIISESAALGLLGGVAGTAAGLIAILTMCVARDWTPLVDPALLAAAPAIGLAVGIAAGLYPTARAIKIEPSQALRDA